MEINSNRRGGRGSYRQDGQGVCRRRHSETGPPSRRCVRRNRIERSGAGRSQKDSGINQKNQRRFGQSTGACDWEDQNSARSELKNQCEHIRDAIDVLIQKIALVQPKV